MFSFDCGRENFFRFCREREAAPVRTRDRQKTTTIPAATARAPQANTFRRIPIECYTNVSALDRTVPLSKHTMRTETPNNSAAAVSVSATNSAPASANVTAIVPVRNEEAVIVACVESLARQPEIAEILVVNDESSDRTAE